MPKIHFVKKARKDNPVCKKGESYYWWQNAFHPKRFSLKRPTRAMLTTSGFLSQLYTLEDETLQNVQHPDDLPDIISEIEEMRDECESSLSNMPDSLQEAPTGELLQERIDALEAWAEELQDLIDTHSDLENLPEDEKDETLENFREDVSSCQYPG